LLTDWLEVDKKSTIGIQVDKDTCYEVDKSTG
jgi:hypothetical protein